MLDRFLNHRDDISDYFLLFFHDLLLLLLLLLLLPSNHYYSSTSNRFYSLTTGSFIIGDLSDRIGRHRALMFSIIGLLGTGCGTAYMKTYWGIVSLRTASAAFATGAFIATYVLGVEMMGPAWRY